MGGGVQREDEQKMVSLPNIIHLMRLPAVNIGSEPSGMFGIRTVHWCSPMGLLLRGRL